MVFIFLLVINNKVWFFLAIKLQKVSLLQSAQDKPQRSQKNADEKQVQERLHDVQELVSPHQLSDKGVVDELVHCIWVVSLNHFVCSLLGLIAKKVNEFL